MADGVPTRLKYHGKKDTSKLLIFSIPDGAYTFSVQVKSKTENFYPRLYVKYYEDLEASYRTLEFPPGGEPGYFICKQWDYKMGVLNYEEQFDNIKGGNAGLVLNLLEEPSAAEGLILPVARFNEPGDLVMHSLIRDCLINKGGRDL